MLQVTHGDSPVINANIEVNITVRMNNGSVARVNNLTMLDNGYGGKCHLSHACRAASKLRAKHEMGKTIPYILFSVTTSQQLETLQAFFLVVFVAKSSWLIGKGY